MSDRSLTVLGFFLGLLLGTYATFAIHGVLYPTYDPYYLTKIALPAQKVV